MKINLLVLALFGLLLASSFNVVTVRADDDDDAAAETAAEAAEEEDYEQAYEPDIDAGSAGGVHPLTDMPEASPDVITAHFFTESPHTMAVGKETTVVIGLINNGEHSINITRAMGSLNSPANFDMYVQNFTMRGYQPQVEIPAGEERAVEFTFTPREDIEPVDFIVCLTVFYEDDEETFSSQFFNQTVKFYEPPTEMTAESVGNMVMGAVVVAALLYYVASLFGGKKGGRARTEQKSKEISGADDEWIDHSYHSPEKSSKKKRN
jgi:hypothetical protein